MNQARKLKTKRIRRVTRNRSKIFGTSEIPRLAVFRSNRFIYVQLINDEIGKTIIAVSPKDFSAADKKKNKTEQAEILGKLIAERAIAKKINQVVYDRRSYRYHGRVAAVAEAARKAGLKI